MTKKTLNLMEALRKQWPHPDYAFISEFRGGTGWAVESRVDAIAMDLWPSRGLELIGFEVKTSRADWLKELKQPEKADPLKQFCDKWYLVTDDSEIVNTWKNEIPEDWGYMHLESHTKYTTNPTFKLYKEAPKLNPKPIDRHFLASLMRLASNPFDEVIINGRKYSTAQHNLLNQTKTNER